MEAIVKGREKGGYSLKEATKRIERILAPTESYALYTAGLLQIAVDAYAKNYENSGVISILFSAASHESLLKTTSCS
jgi:hypothetical protein